MTPQTVVEIASVTDDQMYGREALSKGEPWIVPAALEHLRGLVRSRWHVFEWGCGGSTVWFCQHCASVIGVEHNNEWIVRVGELMEKHHCYANWTVRYIKGQATNRETGFREYADAILAYPECSFDLVSVDGEASCRDGCIDNALDRVKPGGYLLLDNSNWFRGEIGWRRWDYVVRGLRWIGQPGTFDWWTSILRKPARG